MLAMLERRRAQTDHTDAVIAAVRPDYEIHGPFWSQAFQAFRLEYLEQEPGGQRWQSSFWCSREEDATELAREARTVTDRAGWLALRAKAQEIARGGDAVLYRTMLGEHSETFR